MFAEILGFLKTRLNAHFNLLTNGGQNASEDLVVFIDGDQKPDSISFKLGAISLLLFNIEQDNTLRQADSYKRIANDGSAEFINPDIIVNLYILLVAKFPDYKDSLRYLSLILRYFQANPYFDRQNSPDILGIDHFAIELNAQTTTQQNELWGVLRSSYVPSLVYKIKAVTFTDEAGLPLTDVREIILNQEQL